MKLRPEKKPQYKRRAPWTDTTSSVDEKTRSRVSLLATHGKNSVPVVTLVWDTGYGGVAVKPTFPNKTSCKMATSTGGKPVQPMKLFSEWDVENTAPNCIPRYYIWYCLIDKS